MYVAQRDPDLTGTPASVAGFPAHIHMYVYIHIYMVTSLHDLHHSHYSLNSSEWQSSFYSRDRDVGRDRIKDRIIKTSLDLHTSDRSPDHRVCALASPTTATSIRSNKSKE